MRLPIAAMVILIIVSVLADLYILKDIRQYCKSDKKNIFSWIYLSISIVFWALIIVAVSLPRTNATESILPAMWMIYIFVSVYIPKFLYIICSAIGRIIFLKRTKRNFGILPGIVIAVIIFIIMWIGVFYTRHDIVINRVEIKSSKLPESFNGFKIIQFSDTHVGTWGNDTSFVSKLVNEINSQKPDLILFTGDMVNRESSEAIPFKKIFSRLKATHGVYAIFGNHDYAGYVKWPDPADANKDCAKLGKIIQDDMGWKMLNNRSTFITNGNDSIVLIGVENWGEPPFNQLGDLGKSYPESPDKLHGLNDNMFKILMTHNPMHWKQVATDISNIDLTLSGHTHAMQMMIKIGDFKWSPSSLKYKEWGGLYHDIAKDGTPMNLYVNIGAGMVGMPARLLDAKPEITVFTLSPINP